MSRVPKDIGERLAHVEAMKPVIAARKAAREAAAAAPAERRRREEEQRRRDEHSARQVRAHIARLERDGELTPLAAWRGRTGLSQSAAAAFLGVERKTYAKAERDVLSVNPDTRWKIALALASVPRLLWPRDGR